MDFQNKHFQKFLRMKDSEVKKLLNKHPKSSTYYKYNEITTLVGKSNRKILLYDGINILVNDSHYHQYTFEKYLKDKESYTKSFFATIGTDATLNFIERRAKFYYGEENVWLDEENYSVVIHFPEITITNSLGDSHVMRDLFFKISVYKGKINELALARTTFHENEIGVYLFSHESSRNIGKYSIDLCFGETEFNEFIKKSKIFNDFRFIDKMIVSLGGYLSWESLEGVPYVQFSGCKYPKYDLNIAYYQHSDELIEIGLGLIYNSELKLRYKVDMDFDGDTIIYITNKYEIDNLLKNKLIPQFIRFNNFSYKNLVKKECPSEENYTSNVRFKDKIIPIKFIRDDSAFENEMGCHIELLNKIVDKIELDLLNHLIEKDNE